MVRHRSRNDQPAPVVPPSLEIIARDPRSLKPHPRNARTHPEKQIAKLTASIRAMGFNVPVLISSDDTILAGHCRVIAAIAASLQTIPTICLQHLTRDQQRLFLLADNKLSTLATWDEEFL